jgi:hypothetical protein
MYATTVPTEDRTLAERLRAVEDELLLGAVVNPVGLPPVSIRRQPDLPALLALRNDRDPLGAHDDVKSRATQGSSPTTHAS